MIHGSIARRIETPKPFMIASGICQSGIAAAMASLQLFYNSSTGLWDTANWWNAANALETTIQYSHLTDTLTYRGNVFNTFYQKPRYANFLNPWFRDDDGWWALTWIKAYDLTGDSRYLEQAKSIFWDMTRGWDNVCGGGLYWHKRELNYKNAITNSLFLSVAAKLSLRSPTDPRYRDWATRSWQWFNQTGMINAKNLVNDGLNSECRNNDQTTWTYNQGVLIGALVDLHRLTDDPTMLKQAEAIADAAIVDLAPNGILREPCESKNDCGDDAPQFKGVMLRNLAELYAVSPKPTYREFINRNAQSIWNNRNATNQFGLSWSTAPDKTDAKRQSSAIDALNAFLAINTQGTYFTNASSDQLTDFRVSVACSGNYDLAFRYTARDDAARYVHVNHRIVVDRQIFPDTHNSWQTMKIDRVWLNAGENTVSIIFDPTKGSVNSLSIQTLSIEPSRSLK